jgi:hypothetical protein
MKYRVDKLENLIVIGTDLSESEFAKWINTLERTYTCIKCQSCNVRAWHIKETLYLFCPCRMSLTIKRKWDYEGTVFTHEIKYNVTKNS